MPFTLAHPAAAVPLLRPLRRFGVLSALVAGSAAPDLEYFLPLNLTRQETHSPAGLFWFCLPAGLLTYALFHLLLKGPLLGLLPTFVFSRLGAYAARYRSFPPVTSAAVIVSLLCGSATHLIWDAFTHAGSAGARWIPVLDTVLFRVGRYPVYVYEVLQQGSTLAGLALLAFWSWRWLAAAPSAFAPLPILLSPRQRAAVVTGLICTPLIVASWAVMRTPGSLRNPYVAQAATDNAVFAALPALTLAIVGYSLVWHVWAARARVPA